MALGACSSGGANGRVTITPSPVRPGQAFTVTATCPQGAVPQVAVEPSPRSPSAPTPVTGRPGEIAFRAGRPGTYRAHLGCGAHRVTRDFGVVAAAVVGLGDSYSSGEGASAYDPQTATPADRCHRAATSTAWEPGVASQEHRPFDFGACSGAVIADFYRPRSPASTEIPQLDHLGPTTDLVTMTIGGNDVGFAPVLADCIAGPFAPGTPGCAQRDGPTVQRELTMLGTGSGATCSDISATSCAASAVPSLHQLYEDAARRSGARATVVVVGYPAVFAAVPTECAVGSLVAAAYVVTPGDAAWLDATARQLNSVIAAEVGIAQRDLLLAHSASTIRFVAVDATFEGHRLCAGADPWLHGLEVSLAGVSPSSFHPNDAGQAAILGAVEATIPGPSAP